VSHLSTNDLRQRFLDFFQAREHRIVASSPLVPGNDPTLLFTNAGMVQFKDTFLGREPRDYVRATSSQRCVRAGGKHNDLENVGYTARHHTFFEMLGNFSFGDYFKREAIQFAWQFLTEELGLPADKLWVTVFDEDNEAADIWLNEVGVDPQRFTRIGSKADGSSDNFWQMGDTGPCGPCTEIFYDHGADIEGGPPGTPEEDGDRYIEIWNLVFMQYNRSAEGELKPLPKPSVDTGMGLERLAAVMQDVHANYEIDLFVNLLGAVAKVTGRKIGDPDSSLKVIADHIRSASFLIVDGVLPSNEGRGYVLRRIIRRAIRHGYKLGVNDAFFHQLVAPLDTEMGEAYPELRKAVGHVEKVLAQEEARFAETLDQGMKVLEADLAGLSGLVIPGETVFRLYDTFGFPVDLTADIARERGLSLDQAGFEAAMTGQRDRARAAGKFGVDYNAADGFDGQSEFSGYTESQDEGTVIALFREGQQVDSLAAGDEGMVVLDRTPFYAESGGQVGDAGELTAAGTQFAVADTQKRGAGAFGHIGKLTIGEIEVGGRLEAQIDLERRGRIIRNHSATHLLHAALREHLGEHVSQKGSLVDPQRLRFDFSHYEPMTAEELRVVEDKVNAEIRKNAAAEANVMSYDQAIESGAMALFGEKYGDEVRVLKIGEFSTELCGGTHVQRAGDIGLFKITSESGVASGVRRIEAVTGEGAMQALRAQEAMILKTAAALKADSSNLAEKAEQMAANLRSAEKELQRLKQKLASGQGSNLAAEAVDVEGIKVLAARVDGVDPKTLRDTVDQLKNKLGAAAIVLGTANDGKVSLIAGVTAGETARVHAGKLVGAVAQQVGGKGGGRPDMAQAGGTEPDKLDAALASVEGLVRDML